jgi:hypothetical protein
MHHLAIEACPAYAVITLDRRGNITQLSAPDIDAAMQIARKYEKARISVCIEDKEGRCVYARDF